MNIIDLSYPITTNMPIYPGDKEVEIVIEKTWETDGYRLSFLTSSMHAGTHIDAPSHLSNSKLDMSDIKLNQCIGRGVLIDVRDCFTIEITDVENYDIREGDIVIFLSGWSKHYGTKKYDEHPVISEEVADVLVTKKIKMIGLDMPSCDIDPYPVHKILMKSGILIAENLCNCESLLEVETFDIYAIPLKIDAEASLARVFAITKEKTA
ncbi:MAG: cyclase family protein [Erysipelothrix sp.]|nr:cyclase family protein [Erysipelothrix sp.]